MYFKTTFESEFEDLYMYLRSKYPAKLFDLEGIGSQTDMALFSKRFFSEASTTADASVDANSNVDDMTVVAYENELPKPYTRMNSLYLLWKYGKRLFGLEYANRMVEKEITGELYVNDMSNVQKPYCFNFSTMDLLIQGLPFVKKILSNPPKHLSSFCGQMIHFTSYASNQILGACGVADLLLTMSWFVKKELEESGGMASKEYIWKQIRQEIQSLIYSMNQPFRGGLQSGFYNVSIYDDEFLNQLREDYIFPDGSQLDLDLVRQLQELFIDMMNETMEISPITFPVVTACFSVDDENNIIDEHFLKFISEKNKKWAFINIYAGKTSTLSSCCRLRSDKSNEYLGYSNSFGAGNTRIGSFGVCTVNLPRVALKANGDKEKFFELLRENVEFSHRVNHTRRYIIGRRIEKHALPLFDYGFMDLQRQYATVGVVGIYEALQFMGLDILKEDGQAFCKEILQLINDMNDKADSRFKYAHNVEQIPAETVAIKLAQKDELLGFQNTYKLYSNQFIPLIATANMLDRIRLQGMFDSQFSGGSILHINCDSPVEKAEDIAEMIKSAVKCGCVYHAINYNLQKCEAGHMSVGKNTVCPECGKPITDNYIRVVGFIVNVKNFHQVRREEDYAHRQFYSGKDIEAVSK